jgi:hypothetical protein
MESEVMKKETVTSSKIIKSNKKSDLMDQVEVDTSRILSKVDLEQLASKESKKLLCDLFSKLKNYPASHINYFIKQSVFEDDDNVTKLLMMFFQLFKSPSELDIKNVIFKNFIEVSLCDGRRATRRWAARRRTVSCWARCATCRLRTCGPSTRPTHIYPACSSTFRSFLSKITGNAIIYFYSTNTTVNFKYNL